MQFEKDESKLEILKLNRRGNRGDSLFPPLSPVKCVSGFSVIPRSPLRSGVSAERRTLKGIHYSERYLWD
jgi:hypothetical protein